MKLLLIVLCTVCAIGSSLSAQNTPSNRPCIMNLTDGTQWISRDNGRNWAPYSPDEHRTSSGDDRYSDLGVSRLDASGLSVTFPRETTGAATVTVIDILGNVLYRNTIVLSQEHRLELRSGSLAFPATLLALTISTEEHVYRAIVPPAK